MTLMIITLFTILNTPGNIPTIGDGGSALLDINWRDGWSVFTELWELIQLFKRLNDI